MIPDVARCRVSPPVSGLGYIPGMAAAEEPPNPRSLLGAVVGDGVPLLLLTAAGLVLAGGFAMFLGLRGEFLPHDIRHLGMTEAELCRLAECRVTAFMVHDRVAFGGALVSVGTLYGYLALFPLRAGEAWAWWLFLVSGAAGFLTFLTYLGYGYLDVWHAVGTLVLLPVFLIGLFRTRHLARRPRRPWLLERRLAALLTPAGLGQVCLTLGAGGVAVAGLEILRIGTMETFVPEDLHFLGVTAEQLSAVNARLVPVIAHDRAGFGGAVFTTGLTAFGCLLFAPVNRALWQTLLVGGTIALGAALGVHFVVGYVDHWHLAPAVAGAGSLLIGLALTYPATHPVPAHLVLPRTRWCSHTRPAWWASPAQRAGSGIARAARATGQRSVLTSCRARGSWSRPRSRSSNRAR